MQVHQAPALKFLNFLSFNPPNPKRVGCNFFPSQRTPPSNSKRRYLHTHQTLPINHRTLTHPQPPKQVCPLPIVRPLWHRYIVVYLVIHSYLLTAIHSYKSSAKLGRNSENYAELRRGGIYIGTRFEKPEVPPPQGRNWLKTLGFFL